MHKLISSGRLILAGALYSVAAFIAAPAAATPEALLAGSPDRGEALTTTCVACHGNDGNSPAGAFPSIAGQNAEYLLKQLHDIKSKRREIVVMNGLLDNLSDADLEDLAAYYAVQTPQQGAADPDLVALGERIYRAGIPRKNIAACSSCHSPQGTGNNFAKFPRLAGQWPEYTALQLEMFRTGNRNNDGDGRMMRAVAMDLSDEEIKAVSDYIYGLR